MLTGKSARLSPTTTETEEEAMEAEERVKVVVVMEVPFRVMLVVCSTDCCIEENKDYLWEGRKKRTIFKMMDIGFIKRRNINYEKGKKKLILWEKKYLVLFD
jgi:hypothetical protein